MTPISPSRRPASSTPSRSRSAQLLVIAWLTVVWVALWGDVSVVTVVSGIVVSAIVTRVFPMSPLQIRLRPRPLKLIRLVLHFLWDVLVASFEVAVKTLSFGRQVRNAVIEVDLHTESDFILTVVAEMVSLVPGSLVVETRASTHTLFLHVLDVGDRAGADAFRDQVFALERRVMLAFGVEPSPAEPAAGTSRPPEPEGPTR